MYTIEALHRITGKIYPLFDHSDVSQTGSHVGTARPPVRLIAKKNPASFDAGDVIDVMELIMPLLQ